MSACSKKQDVQKFEEIGRLLINRLHEARNKKGHLICPVCHKSFDGTYLLKCPGCRTLISNAFQEMRPKNRSKKMKMRSPRSTTNVLVCDSAKQSSYYPGKNSQQHAHTSSKGTRKNICETLPLPFDVPEKSRDRNTSENSQQRIEASSKKGAHEDVCGTLAFDVSGDSRHHNMSENTQQSTDASSKGESKGIVETLPLPFE